MQREGQNTDQDAFHEGQESKTTRCPNCKDTVPATLYCLKCGYPLFNHEGGDEDTGRSAVGEFFDVDPLKSIQHETPRAQGEDPEPPVAPLAGQEVRGGIDLVQEPDEDELAEPSGASYGEGSAEGDSGLGSEEMDSSRQDEAFEAGKEGLMEEAPLEEDIEIEHVLGESVGSTDHSPMEEHGGENEVPEEEPEMDSRFADLTKELANSISLQLWSMNLLQEEGVDEEQFREIFRGYRSRFERCMALRNEMLGEARDLEDIDRKANEARVQLGELEVRRTLGDLHEGEYEALVPALRWTIDHYGELITERNAEIALLEDLPGLIPAAMIEEMKDQGEKAREAMEHLERTATLSRETLSEVKASLEEILSLLDDR